MSSRNMSSLLSLGESFCDEDPLLEPIAERVAQVRSRMRADRRRRGWTVIVGSEGVRGYHEERAMEEEGEVTTTTSSSTRVQQQSFFTTTTTSSSSFSSSGLKQLAQSTFATGDGAEAQAQDGPPRAALLSSMKGSRSPLFGHSLLTRTLQQTQQQQQQQHVVQRTVMQHQMSEDASDAETVIADESSGEETRYRLPSQSSPAEAVLMSSLRQQSSASSTQHSHASSLTPRSSEDTESDRLAFSLEEEDELSEEVMHVEQHHSSHRAVSPAGREGRQWLTADSAVSGAGASSRSMESLRTASSTSRRAYQVASERDLRRVVASSVEARSLESLERQLRRAVSGDVLPAPGSEESALTAAERRRGLFAAVGERRTTVPQHLSLPPPSFLSPGDRRLTILSPHSPEVLHLSSSSSSSVFMSSLKTRRKQAVVLPRLVLPRSESVFSVSNGLTWSHPDAGHPRFTVPASRAAPCPLAPVSTIASLLHWSLYGLVYMAVAKRFADTHKTHKAYNRYCVLIVTSKQHSFGLKYLMRMR
ncbi:hypothetical protein FOCC_FOCC004342 [Frankliniella occidentalis]|nr:hypothetical protein FOCC_FOCC004342 [Frankliniella occidentalis]